mmetsp:Transcript_47574/g.110917  ORF Transcript_47574/g.110917 Transcript_47574/m.110917 type:complete len:274 (-) Transcript_47574:1535-2356(-)
MATSHDLSISWILSPCGRPVKYLVSIVTGRVKTSWWASCTSFIAASAASFCSWVPETSRTTSRTRLTTFTCAPDEAEVDAHLSLVHNRPCGKLSVITSGVLLASFKQSSKVSLDLLTTSLVPSKWIPSAFLVTVKPGVSLKAANFEAASDGEYSVRDQFLDPLPPFPLPLDFPVSYRRLMTSSVAGISCPSKLRKKLSTFCPALATLLFSPLIFTGTVSDSSAAGLPTLIDVPVSVSRSLTFLPFKPMRARARSLSMVISFTAVCGCGGAAVS